MNRLKKNAALVAMGAMALITSCNNPYPDYEEAEEGFYYKYDKPHNEEGKKIENEGVIKLSMIFKNSKDSVVLDSREVSPDGVVDIQYNDKVWGGSFLKALAMLTIGDSASFVISADSIFSSAIPVDKLPPFIKKDEMLTINILVDTIYTLNEAKAEQEKRMQEYMAMMEMRKNEEIKILAKYVEDNKIKTKPTASGLYFIEKKAGSGKLAKEGDKVLVKYTGRFIDGQVFDTSEKEIAQQEGLYSPQREPYGPAEFIVGKLVPGFNEGLKKMKPGSKVQMIIPSSIGYGDGGGQIEPYVTLIFDVELVAFADNK